MNRQNIISENYYKHPFCEHYICANEGVKGCGKCEMLFFLESRIGVLGTGLLPISPMNIREEDTGFYLPSNLLSEQGICSTLNILEEDDDVQYKNT